MKKIISILLVAIMALTLVTPAFAADDSIPVVYIEGQGYHLRDKNGKFIYSLDIDWKEFLGANMTKYLKEIGEGALTGDYSKYCDDLYNDLSPIFAEIKLGKDGESDGAYADTSSRWTSEKNVNRMIESLPTTSVTGTRYVYRWHYDWRLSPLTLAEDLKDIIDTVIAKTGKSQVNIVSRCLGTNITLAYLAKYGTEGKVNSCVLYTSAINGINILDALFSGKLTLDPGALDRFASYFLNGGTISLGDDDTTELIVAVLELLNQIKVLGFGADVVTDIINAFKKDLIPKILKDSYATFPSYWSMVSADYYPAARKFVLGGEEEEWAGLLEKTDAYYEIEKNADSILLDLKENHGVNVAVIAKYGFPCMPVTADATEESDMFSTTKRMSFGAFGTDYDKKFTDSYISKAGENAKYISADRKIDASTCLFPETTWFIKNLGHKYFPDCVNDLIFKIIESNGSFTIDSDPAFTQYLEFTATNSSTGDYLKGTVKPIVTASDTNDTSSDYVKNPLQALFRFFKTFINFIKRFFNK